ncbi:MAG: hypothetical protein DF168_01147 [Candidatus Moanabacter tarae]|uniref:Uncharacterized protein n=1 Tax=Candidatus Moanibacter tarae TaxID=2200854 RepID=A0A2Z4ACS3_9BACT|nr:MAG: hypothetical protein DF168_01147 [Candidatus Moanabacter tarae]|tara:strand:- start:3032 stop:3442 length:411 start_codon:yes stop_codon:yes gene_type:complete
MDKIIFCALTLIITLNTNSRAEASSSNDFSSGAAPVGSPSKLEGTHTVFFDTEKYTTGRSIFLGEIGLPDTVYSVKLLEKQLHSLERYKKNLPRNLPKAISDQLDIGKYAGRLTRREFDSLLYYFDFRYVRPISRG